MRNDKYNYKRIVFALHPTKDKDIIDYLDAMTDDDYKASFLFRRAIRKYIELNKQEE